MTAETRFETLDTHTGGEPTRLITDGLDRSEFEGGSVREQRDAFAETHDRVRELLMKEPRGHDDMFGAVRVPPEAEEADVGLFFMDGGGYLDMCGHGTIGVVTALVQRGELEPKSQIRVETPAGVVTAKPTVEDGRVERVAVRNVRSFVVDETTVTVDADGGELTVDVDVVYAGNFFAMVDGEAVEPPVDADHAGELVDLGLGIRAAVDDAVDAVNPLTGESGEVSITEFYRSDRDADRTLVVFGEGSVDRSPCGTGTCAKMTLLHREGELAVGERYAHESVVGSRFTGRLLDAETRDGLTVTTPEVSGRAYVTGEHSFVSRPDDSLGGFSVADR
ncbi:proline racemase [Halopelagius inordinatus]|uniref:Proline racemase n=1 Tax=Halopelagius inordinatus TaxID=553467 RepID=A0A1I2T0U6_9EURY|nr:proline racemase family protein [Halopelagius inordinatus]SFG58644.1 proline racemase [Halopelagius inordinatus]